MTGIENLIALAGGQTALARQLGRTQAEIWNWKVRGYAPAKYLDAIVSLYKVDPILLCDPRITKYYKGS